MESVKIKEQHIGLQQLDKLIYAKMPSGYNIREKAHRYFDQICLKDLYCFRQINPIRAEKSLGTLGGGNHFIEADQDKQGIIR